MRIGIFTDFSLPHIGGVETSIFHQHAALRAAGHEVFIISPPMRGPGQQDDSAEHEIRIKSVIPIRFHNADLYYYNHRARQIVDELKLDVVHVESEFPMGCFGVKYARSRGLPVLYTAHTFYPPQIEQYMKYPKSSAALAAITQRIMLGKLRSEHKFEAVDGFQGIPCHTPAQRKILDVWMKFVSVTDLVLAPSHRIQEYVGKYVPDKPIHYAPNPFASPITDSSHATDPVHAPIRIMTSSVLRPEKRIDVLVEAVSRLDKAEQAGLTLDIYGGGDMYDPIQQMIVKNDLAGTVRMHGMVDNHDIQKALIDHDVMVSMSVGFDNQPMTILEAVHAGCMVMYVDKYLTEGTAGDNSLLSEPDTDGLVTSLRTILADPKKVSLMKKNSKALAEDFNYQAYVRRFEAALKAVMKTES
jgi:1,2-diacylglycerol 3-alpha-glucosyltransferase